MLVTVFTPTFNRRNTINRLYESLQRQTNRNFEWVVVDDGSTDSTNQYFKEIIVSEHDFNITYVEVPNGGKHRAINLGVSLAKGELFFIVDSDDYITDDAIDFIIKRESELPKDIKWAGLACCRGYDADTYIGTTFLDDFVDATAIERREKNIEGDKSEVFYTHVLKQFPFKEFEGENFLTESSVWLVIALSGYKMRWFNKINYICNYLEGGLTSNYMKNNIKNPQGLFYSAKVMLQAFPNDRKRIYGTIYRSYYVGKCNGIKKKEVANKLEVSCFKINVSIFLNAILSLFRRK